MSFFGPSEAHATYRNRLSLMAGRMRIYTLHKTYNEFGGEWETRLNRYVGLGLMGNYATSNSRTTIIGAPEFFLHPFRQDWFINTAPIIQMRQSAKTSVGVRVGTRLVLPWVFIRYLRIAPFFDYDFINHGPQYSYGLSLEFHGY